MDAQAILDNFRTIAEAPGGVELLRDAVRDLAIRGRLATGDDADVPAAKLLQRTAKARDALIEQGSLRVRALPADQDLTPPFALPKRWAWSLLARSLVWDLTDGDWVESKDQDPDGDVRLLQLADVGVGDFKDKSARFLTSDAAARLNCTYLSAGDVLIARLPSPLGRSCVFPGIAQPAVTVVDVAIARGAADGMVGAYLALALNSPTMRGLIAALATGTTRQRVSTGNLRKLAIPVPPLAEQERIVARVGELMQLCDDLEARQQHRRSVTTHLRVSSLDALTNASIDDDLRSVWSRLHTNWEALTDDPQAVTVLRRSLLQLAVAGRLHPAGEPNAGNCRSEADSECLAEAPSIDTPDQLPGLPVSWRWVRLGDLIDGIEAGKSPTAQARRAGPGEWGVLKVSACSWGQFKPEENKALFPGTEFNTQHQVRQGDFLISRANTQQLVARSVIVEDTPSNLLISDKTLRLRVKDCCIPEFLNLANLSDVARSHYESNASGTSDSMRNVSQAVIRNTPIPLPPLEEQRKVVETYARLTSHCDELASVLARRGGCAEAVAVGLTR